MVEKKNNIDREITLQPLWWPRFTGWKFIISKNRYDSFQINQGYGWVRFIQIGIFFSALAWNQCERYFPVCVGVLDFPDNSILVFNPDNRSVESKNFHRYIVEFFILPEFTIEYAYHHLWNVSSKQAPLFPSHSSLLPKPSNLPTRYFDEKKNNYGFCREKESKKKKKKSFLLNRC